MESKLWQDIETLVRGCGFELFELDEPPSTDSGTLRVFISRPRVKRSGAENATVVDTTEPNGLNVDDCAKVSRTIEAWLEDRQMFGEELILEVSSPGINRKLSRPEHFFGACGERVRLTLREQFSVTIRGKEKRRVVVVGELQQVTEEALVIFDEELKEVLSIPRANVKEARVDFPFGNPGRTSR